MSDSEIKKRIETIEKRQIQIDNLLTEEKRQQNQERSQWTNLTQLEYLEKLKEADQKELVELFLEIKKYK